MDRFTILTLATVVLATFAVHHADAQQTHHRTHLVTMHDLCTNQLTKQLTITLGGPHIPQIDGHEWRCPNESCAFRHRKVPQRMRRGTELEVNVKQNGIQHLNRVGIFTLYYGAEDGTGHLYYETIKLVLANELPVHYLAKPVVSQLSSDIFHHLYLKHNLQRHDNFYPHVSGYLGERIETLTKRRDQIAQYVLEKHATTETTERGKPNYSCSLTHGGLKFNIDVGPLAGKTEIEEALSSSYEMEKYMIQLLTETFAKSEAYGDDELSEFISGDLLPGMLEAMKGLAGDLETVTGLIRNNNQANLGRYIFDQTNYKSE